MKYYRELELQTTACQKLVTKITDYGRVLQHQSDQANMTIRQDQATQQQKKEAKDLRDSLTGKINNISSVLQMLNILQNKIRDLYRGSQNDPKKFKKLNLGNVSELKTYYGLVHNMVNNLNNSLFPTDEEKRSKDATAFVSLEQMLDRDQALVNLISEKDGLSLPESIYKVHTEKNAGQYNGQNVQFKWPGFFEYEGMFLTNPQMTHDQVLARYMQKSADEVKTEFEEYARTNPRYYEYPPSRGRLDPVLRNTGNVDTINTALETDEQLPQDDPMKFSHREREMLKHHRDATLKVQQVNDSIQEKLNNGQELGQKLQVQSLPNGGVMLNIDLDRFQTSANGCWSCAGQLMARGRGISNDVTQEDIRSYRPDLNGEQVNANDDVDENYNLDYIKALKDNSDSILKFAPNSMMHTVEIAPYSTANEEDGYTSDKYIKNTVNTLKTMINHAIKVDRSPVAFYRPGHYVTIVGIEGDEVLYKDSYQWAGRKEPANHTFRRSLKSLVESNYFCEQGAMSIEINWLSDVQLAQDGKTIHGVPSQYVYMKEDGSVTKQPTALLEVMGDYGSRLNRVGVPVLREAQDEEEALRKGKNNYGTMGVLMSERVYLPKNLNADYLKKRANARSAEDEAKLNQTDTDFYKIKPGKIDPATVEDEIREKIRRIENEKKPGGNNDGDLKDEEQGPDIDTRSDNTKQQEKEARLQAKINARIEDAGRRFMDDTTIKGDYTAMSRRAMDKHLQGVSREEKLNKEKRQVEAAEKALADRLKAKYTDQQVAQKAAQLIGTMSQHDPWYLWNTTGAFKELKECLKEVQRLGMKAADPNRKDQFTAEDRKKLEEAVLRSAELSKSYLSSKMKEMEQDPARRNKLSKGKYEQPRIKSVLDAYDFFSEAALAVKAKDKAGEKDIRYAHDDISEEYNLYQRELVTDREDPAAAQEDSINNRLYIPTAATQALGRLEKLFGITTSNEGAFKKVAGIDQLKKITMHQPIGGGSSSRLSNKDFAALAIAASTTPEAMRREWKGADPERRFTEKEKLDYYAGETLHALIHGKVEGISKYIPEIRKSRNLADRALTAYAGGDKAPLARLIANGIKNLNGIGAGGRFNGAKDLELFSAELGLRLKSMLERDPELMKKALSYGVTPQMLKNLKNKGVTAGKGVLAGHWQTKTLQQKEDNWGIREKERNYVDMLVNRYMEEERSLVRRDWERTPEYKEAARKLQDKYTARNAQDRNAYKNDRLEAVRRTAAYKTNRNTLQATFNNGKSKLTKQEQEAARASIDSAMAEKTDDIVVQIRLDKTGYEDGLIRKYEARMKENDAKKWDGGYEKAKRETLVAKALQYEQESFRVIPSAKPEELKVYQSGRDRLAEYEKNVQAIRRLDALDAQFAKKQEENNLAKQVEIHALQKKGYRQAPTLEEISDPGAERALRNQFREYVRFHKYLDMPPKKFAEEVVGTEKKPQTRKRLSLKVELDKMKVMQEQLKAREKRQEKAAQAGAKPTANTTTKTASNTARTSATTKPGAKGTRSSDPGKPVTTGKSMG